MKGMLGLWKNESIKIFRPVANKIILIIAVLLIAVPPCFTYIISRSENGGYDEYYYVPDDDADAEVKVYFMRKEILGISSVITKFRRTAGGTAATAAVTAISK